MKSLIKMGLIFIIIFLAFTLVMIMQSLASPALPLSLAKLGPATIVNTVANTIAAFCLLLLLIGFKQGVEGSKPAVYGSFAGAQFVVLCTMDVVLQAINMTSVKGEAQIVVWYLVGVLSAFFSVLIYGLVQTQRRQLGELVSPLPSKAIYTLIMFLGYIGFLIGVGIILYALNESDTPLNKFSDLKGVLNFLATNWKHLGWVALLMWIAFLRGWVAIVGKAIAAIGTALLMLTAFIIIKVSIFQIAPNLANNCAMMVEAAVFCGLGAIFFLEIYYVFAPEAGH